jgi:hypothetical protein
LVTGGPGDGEERGCGMTFAVRGGGDVARRAPAATPGVPRRASWERRRSGHGRPAVGVREAHGAEWRFDTPLAATRIGLIPP